MSETIRSTYRRGLLAMGWVPTELSRKSTKWTSPKNAQVIYQGSIDSLRVGATKATSVPVGPVFRQQVLTAAELSNKAKGDVAA